MEKTCVIVLSFGMGAKKDNFGLSNWELAKIASSSNFPVIAQWEVANIMNKIFFKPALISIERDNEKYLSSYDVLLKAKLYMGEKCFTEAILVGHQDLMPRMRLIAKKMGIKLSKKIYNPNKSYIPYDLTSTQWWTRNQFYFWLREIPVYIFMFLKGQI